MSVESISKVLHLSDDRLSPTHKLLLIGIANHDGDGGAWPSIDTLCLYVGVKERQLRYLLRQLEALGFLSTEMQEGGSRNLKSRRRPNLYHLHLGGSPSAPLTGGTAVPPNRQEPRAGQAGDEKAPGGARRFPIPEGYEEPI